MTILELQRLKTRWQRRLRILDWDVSISFATSSELEDCYGDCAVLAEEKCAKIRILRQDDWVGLPTAWSPEQVTATLVHELLHIPLAPWPVDSDAAVREKEQAINCMTTALYQPRKKRAA